jgi:arsenate reductase
VVFACVQNAGRSQIAAAFFNQMADPARAIAVSGGTNPAGRIHPPVVAAMKEVGIDLSQARPRILTDEAAARAKLLVTLGCGDQCPVIPGARHEDWPIDDPAGQDVEGVRHIRDDILARVQALIEAQAWGRTPAPRT